MVSGSLSESVTKCWEQLKEAEGKNNKSYRGRTPGVIQRCRSCDWPRPCLLKPAVLISTCWQRDALSPGCSSDHVGLRELRPGRKGGGELFAVAFFMFTYMRT